MDPEPKVSPLYFAYDLPFVSQRKCTVIKVVAKHFVFHPEKLRNREKEFDFLQNNHVLHPLFRAFVKQFELIKNEDPLPTGNVLQRAIERAKLLPKPPQTTEPVVASGSSDLIDWQDFIVLETVEFFSADHNGTSKLGKPLSATEMRLMRDQPQPSSEVLFRSALTGEMVPESLYNEHIKTLQIDPTSRVQKEKEQKRSESNLDYDNVAKNLENFRQKRQKLDFS